MTKDRHVRFCLPAQAETECSRFRTMTAICFVCNLPILSHQVGLIWQGGNGWDDLMRQQVEESTLKQRLGKNLRFSEHLVFFAEGVLSDDEELS